MTLDEDARRGRFFELWTLKEAFVKALGTGMAAALDQLIFTIAPDGGIHVAAPGIDAGAWQFGVIAPNPRYRLAVAVHRPGAEPAQLLFRSTAHVA